MEDHCSSSKCIVNAVKGGTSGFQRKKFHKMDVMSWRVSHFRSKSFKLLELTFAARTQSLLRTLKKTLKYWMKLKLQKILTLTFKEPRMMHTLTSQVMTKMTSNQGLMITRSEVKTVENSTRSTS